MQLTQLTFLTGGQATGEAAFDRVTDRLDEVRQGTLFVCVRGGRRDTHEDVPLILAKGASAIVCERKLDVPLPQLIVGDTRKALGQIAHALAGDPTRTLKLVGVTGTNGKTSICYILRKVFAKAGYKCCYIGTLGVVDEKGQTSETPLTTPDTLDLVDMLQGMAARGVQFVFLEVSAHAAHFKKVAGCRFAAMILTNLTQDHLDFFGNMAEYASAKRSLFDPSITTLGIVNTDDELGRNILRARPVPILSYGLYNPADVFAILMREGAEGMDFTVNAYDMIYRVKTTLHGEWSVYNVLAVATAAGYFGIAPATVQQVLTDVQVPGRFSVVQKGGVYYVIDYAHTPDGLDKSLKTARAMTSGRVFAVFGCGGERDRDKRAKMGRIAAKGADYVIVTSDNPRSEKPMDIARDIEAGMSGDERAEICLDRSDAIRLAAKLAGEGDVVLIAGKGAETYLEQDGKRIPYSDFDVVDGL